MSCIEMFFSEYGYFFTHLFQLLITDVKRYCLENLFPTIIFNKNFSRFYKFQTMQLSWRWQMWFQFFPNAHYQVFNRTKFPFHKIHINVQVTVIKFFNYLFIDQSSQFFCIKNKTTI